MLALNALHATLFVNYNLLDLGQIDFISYWVKVKTMWKHVKNTRREGQIVF